MLDVLKSTFTQKLNPIRVAETKEELEAVWAFRYNVQVRDLKRHDFPNADHDNGWIRYDSDEQEDTQVLYSGAKEKIKATLKLRVFAQGKIPDEMKEEFELDLFEDIGKRKVSRLSSLSFSNSAKGQAIATALICDCVERVVGDEAEIVFVSCEPDHLQMYQSLGLRPYGGRVVNKNNTGLLIPLMGALDINYFTEVNSPLAEVMKKLERAGKTVSINTDSILKVMYEASGSVESDRDVIKNEILTFFQQTSSDEETNSSLLSALSEPVIDWVAESAHLIDIAPGDQVIQQEVSDQELYFILDGLLEVRREEDVLMRKGKGTTLGEVGFFRESGKRAASVFAVEQTRLLVLRKSFLTRLVQERPADACVFYESLASVMAEHIAGGKANSNLFVNAE